MLLTSRDGRAVYVGPNGDRVCETCGGTALPMSKHQFGESRWLLSFCLALARKRYHKRNGGTCVSKAENYATKLAKFPDRAAAIVAKTYAVMGDAAFDHGLPNDTALVMIMDLINDIDPTLIERNAKKKLLARPRRSS